MTTEKLSSLAAQIDEFDLDKLERQGTDFPFTDVRPLIERGFAAVKQANADQQFWASLPDARQNQAIGAISAFGRLVDSISKFNPQGNQPSHDRNQLAQQLTQAYDVLFQELIQYLWSWQGHSDPARQEAQAALVDVQATRESLALIKQEAGEVLEAAKNAAVQSGVWSFADVFKTAADGYEKTAMVWLKVSVVSGVILLGILILFVLQLINTLDTTTEKGIELGLQVFIAKVLVLSFASIFVLQLFKNFSINKHLETLNRHRQHCLTSFEAFVKSAKDETTMDAVLVQATKAIFDAGDTGYVSHRDGSGEIIRVVEQMTKRG